MAALESPHKSRKKKKGPSQSVKASEDTVITSDKGQTQVPAFPLVAFLWPARTSTSQWILLPVTLMVVGLFRWTVGFWGYSGKTFIDFSIPSPLTLPRLQYSTYAWRFRGSTTLDGDDNTSSNLAMVFS